MKAKQPTEFEEFDRTVEALLAVPYSELQQKLEQEKRAKAQKKKRATSSPASSVRASSSRKKRVA